MKTLHYLAFAEHPKVTGALISQTARVLDPFSGFVRQAMHTARLRQTRYRLPWTRVQERAQIRLEALDALLVVPRGETPTVLCGWSAPWTVNETVPGFVVNRSVPVQIRAVGGHPEGLLVESDPPLENDDTVVWKSQQTRVRCAPLNAPAEIGDASGARWTLRGAPVLHDDGWRMCVEGRWSGGDATLDGVRVSVQLRSPFDELSALRDGEARSIPGSGESLWVDEAPTEDVLVGDNGVRFRWHAVGAKPSRGVWVQLQLPTDLDVDGALDPRAAFVEGEVKEVWTSERRSDDVVYRVKRVDAEAYRLLLDRAPPANSALHLPVETRNLDRQRQALAQLQHSPLPHHRPLLRLCEDPDHVRWPSFRPEPLPSDAWRFLRDATRDGTEDQRRFVERALKTPDFVFLEGPPGSGKTTAICELIWQLTQRGERVLLCASTHYALDNVLERVVDARESIDAVRIGKLDRVDERVAATQIDHRVEALLEAWRALPAMRALDEETRRAIAERTVLAGANLTCGTIMGILGHPYFHTDARETSHGGPARRPLASLPHWDVLIVDEASKTLIQEFLVPALSCRRWVIVGDVRQLAPFSDREDIVANLRTLVDARDQVLCTPAHQRACLLVTRLLHESRAQAGVRWMVSEPGDVLDAMERELAARGGPVEVARVVRTARPRASIAQVTLQDLRDGTPAALAVLAAQWLLVDETLLPDAEDHLPGDLLPTRSLTRAPSVQQSRRWLHRHAWSQTQLPDLPRPVRDRGYRNRDLTRPSELGAEELRWLERHDLAGEIAWRLTRAHELRHRRAGVQERLRRELHAHLPAAAPESAEFTRRVEELEDIGLPSILEVLQQGIGQERSERRSALTAGFAGTQREAFAQRFQRLAHQHRMHPEISRFPRDMIYRGEALHDANTIALRDAALGWDFDAGTPRCVWNEVSGSESGGVNQAEVDAVMQTLERFLVWARQRGAPSRTLPKVWEVACLSFYAKQENAMVDALRTRTRSQSHYRFEMPDAPVEVVCGTVDRFQGREADLVLLSMRNTGRTGFLDSPNRLNVALTRARQQLVVFGRADYFRRCHVEELEELARRTPRVTTARRGGAR